MKILLIGVHGQVGWELYRTMQVLGDVIALDYPAIDLTYPEQIRKQVREIRPDLIVNAAAYTAVDKAEAEPDLAMAINGTAPGILAEEAKRIGAAIVHYSTDYVFDGTKGAPCGEPYGEPYREPYREEDTPNPMNIYGKTKLEGDRAVLAAGCPHLILRLSWVYGGRGKNFMLTILRLAREKEEIRVVDDQIGSPTWCRMIAEATAHILAQGVGDLSGFLSEKGGLYHLSAGGRTSWFGFASAVLAKSPHRKEHKVHHLIPISSDEYPTPARRPACSLLSSDALLKNFGLRLPDWEMSLNLVLDQGVLNQDDGIKEH